LSEKKESISGSTRGEVKQWTRGAAQGGFVKRSVGNWPDSRQARWTGRSRGGSMGGEKKKGGSD